MPAKELYVNSRYVFSRAFSYCSDLWNNLFLIFRSDYKLESGVKEMKMTKEVSGAQLLRMCKALPNYKDTVQKFTKIWFSRTPGRL